MITLTRDTLTFTFPQIAREVRLLVERQIQKIVSELPAAWDRDELVAEVESSPRFDQLSPEAQESARAKIRTWTPTQVESLLEGTILNRDGLNTDSFAELTIKFQRTMRIPDDGRTYPLPTGLGQLLLRSVDDFPETAPAAWMQKGGVIMPLARSEALSIWFSSRYRFAVKIGAGNINVLSSEPWSPDLRRQPQNYLVAPGPLWSDNDEVLRHYLAPPLGLGASVDGQPAGSIQFQVIPMRAESYYSDEGAFFLRDIKEFFMSLIFSPVLSAQLAESRRRDEQSELERLAEELMEPVHEETAHQEILEDPYKFAEWDRSQTVRCCVHPCDSSVWRQITGANPWHPPLTSKDYKEAGIPWFDDYGDGEKPPPEGSSVAPENARRHRDIREFLEPDKAEDDSR